MRSALRERLRTLSTEGQDALLELTEYALQRKTDLRAVLDTTFDAKLRKFANMAASIFDDRKAGTQARPETRTIFDHVFSPNFSLQLVRSVIKFILARIDKDIFGSKPWLAVSPRGLRNQDQAAQMQKHGEYKLDECHWRDRGRGALKEAFDQGWVPVKTTWREEWDQSETLESILTEGEQPVVTSVGDYISPADDTMALDGQMGGEESAEPAGMEDETGEPSAPRVFTKDPSIPAPAANDARAFKSHLIENNQRLYCGLDFTQLAHRDVTWPENAADLSLDCPECDFISVNTQMTVEQIYQSYNEKRDDEELNVILEELRSTDGCPKSEGAKPKEEQGEQETKTTDLKNPTIKVLECYFRRRVLPTGPESRIYMVLAEQSRKPIYVEYLAAISPRSQAPVHMLAINRVPGRAYGRGWYEYFEMGADLLDKLANGIIVRNEYHANTTNFIETKAAESLASGKAISRGPGTWTEVENKQGGPLAALFYTHVIPDLDANSWQLLELVMQLIQTESGVSNAAQGDMSNLPANNTASGVNSLLESSSVLHKYTLEECKSALTPPIGYAMELNYFRQDSDEAYDIMVDASAISQVEQAAAIVAQGPPTDQPQEGYQTPAPAPQAQPGVMTYAQAQKLANIPIHVEILLSSAKRQEQKEMGLAALPIWQNFMTLPAPMQLRGLPLVIQVLSGIGIENPERMLPSSVELKQQIALNAQNGTPPNPPSDRINIAYKDAAPPIKRQIEKQVGLVPLTTEEEAKYEGDATEKDGDKKGGAPQGLPP